MGHPCCNVFDCKEPLSRVTDEFCHRHTDEGSNCCVRGCVMPREPGFRTCTIREHRDEESRRNMRGRKTGSVKKTGRSGGSGKAKSILGSFTRKWTHNEQLMVRPCGIVIGRATFYASENMIGVRVGNSEFSLSTSHSHRRRRYLLGAYSLLIFQDWSPRSFSSITHAGCESISKDAQTTVYWIGWRLLLMPFTLEATKSPTGTVKNSVVHTSTPS